MPSPAYSHGFLLLSVFFFHDENAIYPKDPIDRGVGSESIAHLVSRNERVATIGLDAIVSIFLSEILPCCVRESEFEDRGSKWEIFVSRSVPTT